MILDLLGQGGVGRSAPIRISASQLIVRQDNGTPVIVVYDTVDGQKVAIAGDPNFNSVLKELYQPPVTCRQLDKGDVPMGARLLT